MAGRSALRSIGWLLAGLSAALAAAWFAPPLHAFKGMANYVPLHTFVESFSIVVAMLSFGIAWNAYSRERAGNILLLGCVLLGVGLIDFVHMLSFQGMPAFVTPSDPEKAINFWLAARFAAALAFLAVALLPWKPLQSPRTRYWMLATSLAAVGCVYWIGLFHAGVLPRTFVEGQGLTLFKVGAEYVIIAILGVAALLFYRQAKRPQPFDATSLFAAAAVSVLSELSFTLYADVTDIFNLLGHVYKIIAYIFVYRAVFVASVREPFRRVKESEEQFRALFNSVNDAIFIHDFDGHLLEVNQLACSRLGYAYDQLKSMTLKDIDSPSAFARVQERVTMLRTEGHGVFETTHVTRDGNAIPSEISATVTEYAQQPAVLSVARDITDRKRAENELRRLNRALRMVSMCNEALIRASDEKQLLKAICRTVKEVGQYRFVWVGLAEQDAAKKVRAVAQEGGSDAFLREIDVSWADSELGQCAAGRAIREARAFGVPDMRKADAAEACPPPILPEAASMLALPLVAHRQAIGVISIYSQEPNAFSEQEIDVLTENANDLAFGIVQLRRNQNLIGLAKAIANTGEGIGVVDMSGNVIYQNKALEQWLGPVDQLNAAGGPRAMSAQVDAGAEILAAVAAGHPWHGDVAAHKRDGTPFSGYLQVDPVRDEEERGIATVWVLTDLTEPKQAEIERQRAQEMLQRALHQAIEAISQTVEMRDPYTAGHQRRVAQLAAAVATDLGLSVEQVQSIRLAGIVHDLGKIHVPAEVLSRPGKLTEIEYGLIKVHPQAGYDILKNIAFPWPIAQTVLEHHERLDGSGYPQGLMGDDISAEAKILAVADVVEAMMNHRPYRPGLGLDAALAELGRARGRLYDPAAVDACLRLFQENRFNFTP